MNDVSSWQLLGHSVTREMESKPTMATPNDEATAQGTTGTEGEILRYQREEREGQGLRPGEESRKSGSQMSLSK